MIGLLRSMDYSWSDSISKWGAIGGEKCLLDLGEGSFLKMEQLIGQEELKEILMLCTNCRE